MQAELAIIRGVAFLKRAKLNTQLIINMAETGVKHSVLTVIPVFSRFPIKHSIVKYVHPVRKWWKNRTESEVSKFVPVEDIIAADYNLDMCGFPHDTVEILPPEEFISQYLNEKTVIGKWIESILSRITAAMSQEEAL